MRWASAMERRRDKSLDSVTMSLEVEMAGPSHLNVSTLVSRAWDDVPAEIRREQRQCFAVGGDPVACLEVPPSGEYRLGPHWWSLIDAGPVRRASGPRGKVVLQSWLWAPGQNSTCCFTSAVMFMLGGTEPWGTDGWATQGGGNPENETLSFGVGGSLGVGLGSRRPEDLVLTSMSS
jgi:hypothetical protein